MSWTSEETEQCRAELHELAWVWARRLANLGHDDPPFSPYDANLADPDRAACHLAAAAALRQIRQINDSELDSQVRYAAATEMAGYAEIADALAISRQAARERFAGVSTLPPGRRPVEEWQRITEGNRSRGEHLVCLMQDPSASDGPGAGHDRGARIR